MTRASLVAISQVAAVELTIRRPTAMLPARLNLSRKRLDVCLLNEQGGTVQVPRHGATRTGYAGWPRQTAAFGEPVQTATRVDVNSARFVHGQLELAGWEVAIADAQKVNGLAALACKTDRIDA
jgi:transposase